MPKAQKRCKLQSFALGTHQKNSKQLAKSVQNGPPKRILEFHNLFSHPEPQKTRKPASLKHFGGGALPRVAEAMLSNHHCTARHRRISGLPPDSRPGAQ